MTTDIQITENERKVLRAILTNDFGDGDDLAWRWSNSINDAGEPSGLSGKTLSGVCASLAQKGLVQADGQSGRDACIRLTPAGAEIARR
jgi:DNA-binding MarR family transcriptional regulator